jgi:cell division protein FtsB
MANKRGISRATRAKQAELEERIREMRREEDHIKAKIYKLEASIVAAPGFMAGDRLRNRNLISAEDVEASQGRSFNRTRWQAQRLNRARSRQALTAFLLVAAFVGFVFWFYLQLRNNGVL